MIRPSNVVASHDEPRRRVKPDDRRHTPQPVHQESLGPAFGHLDDVVLVLPEKLTKTEVHADGVFETVPSPPEALSIEDGPRQHAVRMLVPIESESLGSLVSAVRRHVKAARIARRNSAEGPQE